MGLTRETRFEHTSLQGGGGGGGANVFGEVLNKHAPLKTKYIRENNSPFMTKQLRKMIMNRSLCKNAYFKNKTVANWEKYRKLRNDCVR